MANTTGNTALVSLLESQIGKWVSRKDIYRAEPTADSPFIAYSILTDAEGRIAYFDPREEEARITWGVAPLPFHVLPVFRVQRLNYNTESLGTRILSGVKRYFQHEDTVFMAIDLPEGDDAEPVTLLTLRYNRSEKTYFQTKNPLAGVSSDAVLATYRMVVGRLNANKPALDQRKLEWDGQKTAYALYKEQQAADRAARK